MNLMFVADGPRDEASLPGLVQTILGKIVNAQFSAWAHLRDSGKGFDKKLRFAVALTRSRGLHGLVAVVDRDHDHKNRRKAALKACRLAFRDAGERLPIALGVADPHVDIWLLDDMVAVRIALELSTDHHIPNVRTVKHPKAALNDLIRNSNARDENIQRPLARIAAQVRLERCMHAGSTGYCEFHEDCICEFR